MMWWSCDADISVLVSGLSPSWYVQHVIIRDLQSGKSYFFLVNDWLSVGQEDSGRRVEKEIFAASELSLYDR